MPHAAPGFTHKMNCNDSDEDDEVDEDDGQVDGRQR